VLSWEPLLAGDLARRSRLALEEITEDLLRRVTSPPGAGGFPHFSLARGHAGQALFFAYLDRVLPDKGYADVAIELLERAVDALASLDVRSGLYSGFAGVAWVAEHLHGWLLDPDDSDPAEEIMAAVQEHLQQTPWRRHYDLISGLVGFGALGLERHPRSGASECVALVTARLAELAERQGEGLTWLTSPELLTPQAAQMTPHGQYDVGVAHGVPGVVGFLAEAAAARLAPPAARDLLAGAVRWILSCKRPSRGGLFPYHIAPGSDLSGSRLAWCYGDLGIAAVLLAASRHVGEPSWEREALEAARLAAARQWPSSGVRDSCLCHGAAGVAHLFNRLFQGSRDPELAEAARYWFEWTLADRKPGKGCAGFLHWSMTESGQQEWLEDPGFLMGSAGIGLALIAALFPVEPAWDRVLLASIPEATAPAAA
jgi:hypothetical protein